jgi:hypothetical protein
VHRKAASALEVACNVQGEARTVIVHGEGIDDTVDSDTTGSANGVHVVPSQRATPLTRIPLAKTKVPPTYIAGPVPSSYTAKASAASSRSPIENSVDQSHPRAG